MLLLSKWKFILYISPVTVVLNSLPGFNTLQIWQLPHSVLPIDFNIEETNLLCNVLKLKAKTALSN